MFNLDVYAGIVEVKLLSQARPDYFLIPEIVLRAAICLVSFHLDCLAILFKAQQVNAWAIHR